MLHLLQCLSCGKQVSVQALPGKTFIPDVSAWSRSLALRRALPYLINL